MSVARLKILGGCALVAGLLFWVEREPAPEPPPSLRVDAPQPIIERVGNSSRVERVALGRLFTIEAEGLGADTDAALVAAVEELEELDERLSPWRPGSDLWLINARAGSEPVEVDEDTAALLRRAQALSEETEGLYDPTLGAVAVLWPFGDPNRPLPLHADIERALARVGTEHLSLSARTAHLEEAGARVALDGLGVAHAMRRAMTTLRAHGVPAAAVRAGGDLLTVGEGRSDVRAVAIANPRWPGRVVARFSIEGRAVATVDDLHGALTRGGVVIPPVLDPRTGEPALGCRSVTVVTDDPLRARAFAMAVFVRGPTDGLAWIESMPNTAVLLVDAHGQAHRSANWSRLTRALEGAPRNTRTVRTPAEESAPRAPASVSRSSAGPTRGGTLVRIAGDEPASAFWLDRTEVSNAAYRRFLEAERARPHAYCHPREPAGHDHIPRYYRRFSPHLFRAGFAGELAPFDERTFSEDDRPVVGVDYWDAWAFSRWAGKRLPTREELERACSGTDGRNWPFGDTWDPSAVNSGGERDGERDGHTYAAPADSFASGASPAGCLHLAGNVAEWTERRWVVGGSSRSNASGVACGAGRAREAAFRAFDLGFRCAADVEENGS